MLLKSCSRCGKLISYGQIYCEACAPVVRAEREEQFRKRKQHYNRTYNQKRDPKYTRFYASLDWKRLSHAKMADSGYQCECCGGIATEVHHIKPIQTPEGWELRLAWSNLKTLCLTCHNEAHGRFKTRRKPSKQPIRK